jgi:bifunctional DNase/RNase
MCFPLFFEPDDYRVIQAQLDGEAVSSSLMHRLFRAFLDQTQARLEEIRIAKVEEDTVYAELVFALGSEKIQLDAPISNSTDGADIFALALRFQSPIYVSQKSLNADVQPMVPMDRQTKHVVDLAREEAVRLGHCYLGTEHLLLGMIKDSEGKAAQIMIHWGSKLEGIKKSVEDFVGPTDVVGVGAHQAALGHIGGSELVDVVSQGEFA